MSFFRNDNSFSRFWETVKSKHPALDLLMSAINPFPKVSSNLMITAFNYSPFKWFDVLAKTMSNKKMRSDLYNGIVDNFAQAN